MSLRTLMQAGPIKVNELFVRLSETSDGAVKTRERLFGELKTELELHTSLEEHHLFPVLRRNAETKDLVAGAIKDNKDLRAKLAELEVLPKNDAAFPDRLKELQKTFRQHARDEKRELLPAVQRALSEEQVHRITEKIEAGVAEAERARHDEVEARRIKLRQEREQAEQQEATEQARQEKSEQKRAEAREHTERTAKREAAAQRTKEAGVAETARAKHEEVETRRINLRQRAEQQEATEQARQEKLEQKRAEAHEHAERTAKREAAAQRTNVEVERLHQKAKTAGQTATPTRANVVRLPELPAHRLAPDAIKRAASNFRAIASLPGIATSATIEIRAAWMEYLQKTTLAGMQMSKEMFRQIIEGQQRFAANAVRSWMERNAGIMRSTLNLAQRRISDRMP